MGEIYVFSDAILYWATGERKRRESLGLLNLEASGDVTLGI